MVEAMEGNTPLQTAESVSLALPLRLMYLHDREGEPKAVEEQVS
jgi:hypothetical protein